MTTEMPDQARSFDDFERELSALIDKYETALLSDRHEMHVRESSWILITTWALPETGRQSLNIFSSEELESRDTIRKESINMLRSFLDYWDSQ